ncbi:AraC family transcriptional regulator [Anaerosporobacter faecicola]|uniref:AraC family transcriptional regulator n=1 Tax=Anaerosporobacter faecicola TaxID=2718714 RepID=UPI00143C67BF|nr:AraC family transcriptional regulator [Anaerosporobacter faecicola]
MEWLKAMQEAINYMEEHLLENINYVDAAKSVFMSSYNFHKIFTLMAGMTANEYIRNRRLSLAGQELQIGDSSVLDVALKYGYESPDSFTRAFSKFHGVTPKQAKNRGVSLRLFNPLVIKVSLEGGATMEYRLERKESQRFLVLARSFSSEMLQAAGQDSVPDFWKECHDKNLVEPIRNLRPSGKRDLYGINCPSKQETNSYLYGIGIVVDENTKPFSQEELLKQGFSLWETKPMDYIVLKSYGDNGASIRDMWSRFFKEFVPQTNFEYIEEIDYEVYFEHREDGLFCEIWIPVIKKKN